jgi:bleomycin hydrolase
MKHQVAVLIVFLIISWQNPLLSQDISKAENQDIIILKDLPATPAKNQAMTNTCWCFSVISMFESELLRMGKDTFDLSEMFIVRHIYEEKAEKYIRMHGTINFAGGGFFHDVLHAFDTYGIVPDKVYSGLTNGKKFHYHEEMDDTLKEYVDKIIHTENNNINPGWRNNFNEILDSSLGVLPVDFTIGMKKYTPETYASELGLNTDDYIEITSFSHHPFYRQFILEVPDNWAWGSFYNVPLDELLEIIYYSINNGYTVAWSADISDRGFTWNRGVATVLDNMTDNKNIHEKYIDQEIRQEGFNNYSTTDDHGMQITGLATDKNGNKYFRVKNSWGTTGSPYNGYLYASESYVRYKTIAIMVNKNGVPACIRQKLEIN